MKKRTRSILLVLAIAGAFVAGSWYGQREGITPANPAAHETLHRVDLAHAAYASGTPGIAAEAATPILAHAHGAAADSGEHSASLPPGTVNVSPEQQQLIGVRVSAVEEASATHTLRLFGRVAPDETRVHRVNAGTEGVIREVSAVTTGSQVKKGQLLATFTAPNAASLIQLYIINSGAADRVRKAGEGSLDAQATALVSVNIRQRVDQLRSLGMSDRQMEEISRTREFPESIKILAPADGFVLARNVSADLKFDKGVEFYRIADLKRVWIVADVFENEAHYLRPGARAQVSLPNQRKTFPATVSAVLPQFDAATRTLKVRLDADNPGFALRPEMLVDVKLAVSLPATIAVPVGAVLDSGLKKTVFVERGAGLFEPREVETGWRLGERVEIVKGLSPGERIVTAGTFLLDSESRMRTGSGAIAHGGQHHAAATPVSNTGAGAHSGHDRAARDHGGHH